MPFAVYTRSVGTCKYSPLGPNGIGSGGFGGGGNGGEGGVYGGNKSLMDLVAGKRGPRKVYLIPSLIFLNNLSNICLVFIE